MKNKLMTATAVIAIVNNIGFGSFGQVNAASVILSDRQEELITARRPDRGWTYPFTPDYLIAAIKKKPVDYSEEQNLGASCSSRGQVCDNSVIYNVRPSQNHNLIKLTAPSTHCSVVYYFVEDTNDPNHFISSAQLAPGKTKSVNVGLLAKGSSYQFRIRAVGIKDGCNTGQLVSWGVKVRLASSQL